VYQGQKVYLFRPSLGFLAEAQLKTRATKQKTSLEKLQIYFVSTFFKQINLFFISRQQNEKFTICNSIAIIICDVRRRIRHLFIIFAVVLDISSSLSLLLSSI
jgi:hypothetical protein